MVMMVMLEFYGDVVDDNVYDDDDDDDLDDDDDDDGCFGDDYNNGVVDGYGGVFSGNSNEMIIVMIMVMIVMIIWVKLVLTVVTVFTSLFLGIRNITALKNLILWQRVEYDFSFYKTDFQTNLVSS